MPHQDVDDAGLRALFAARSVAIVGASGDPTRIGGRPIHFALRWGFQGTVYPVNPTRSEVQGVKAYPDLASIPGEVDLVVVAVPTPLVGPTIEQAAAKGIKAAIIFSAGFAELGGEGVAEQDRLAARVRALGMRVLGPNCLGLYNSTLRHTPTFASFLLDPLPENGTVALATQSGAFGSYLFMLGRERGIRVSQWTATGNEMDVAVADAVAYYADDPSVSVIACVLEGVKDGPRLLAALAKAHAARKPVLLMKCGGTPAGARAARAHTAASPVDDAAFDAAVRQGGALRVSTTEELLDVLYGLQLRPPLRGRKLGILSISGGAGVFMADAAVRHGLEIPPMPVEAQRRLVEANRLATMTNPIDITAQALNDPSLVAEPARAMLGEGGYDAIAGFFMNYLSSEVIGARMRSGLMSAADGFPDRTIAIASAATPEVVRAFEERGVLMFEDPARAVATLAAMARLGESLRAPIPERTPRPGLPALDGSEADPARALTFLARAGIPVRTGGSAAEGADGIGTGGAGPATREIALVLRVHHDPTFGPVLAVGLGDPWRATPLDLVFGVGTLAREDARRMIGALRGGDVLGADVEALVDVIARVSEVATVNAGRFDAIGIDPLVVRRPGGGCFAVQARVTFSPGT